MLAQAVAAAGAIALDPWLAGCGGSTSSPGSRRTTSSAAGSWVTVRVAGVLELRVHTGRGAVSSNAKGRVGSVGPRAGAGSPTVDGRVTALSADAATGWSWARRTWAQVPAPKRVLVLLPATAADFETLRSGDDPGRAPTGTAASRQAGDSLGATTRSDGVVVLNPDAVDRLTSEGVQVVLAHEFTHVMLGQYRDHRSPRWVVEGSATWASTRFTGRSLRDLAPGVAADVRAGRVPSGPPVDSALAAGDDRVYQAAGVWCAFLVDHFGERRFVSFVRSAPLAETAFVDHFGTSIASLASAYRSFLIARVSAAD